VFVWYDHTLMSRKNILIILILLIIILAGGALYLYGNPLKPTLSYALIETGDRQHKESADYYTVQINYPNKTPLATRGSWGADNRAEGAITSALSQLITQFKQAGSVDALSQEEKDRLNKAGLKYSLNVAYHPYSSGSYVSYEFDVFMDTGGAHPNNFYKTLVFDLGGNTVALEDLFQPGSNYLDRISQAAQTQVAAQIKQRAGADAVKTIITDGITPKVENFENFVVDSDHLTFFIPPYQAASYAAGSFEVHVPLADLKDILKPEVK
jgi:hypothetical protein